LKATINFASPLKKAFSKPKKITMKKVFAIMALAGLLAACNNKSENKEQTKDTTTQTMDNKMMGSDTSKMMSTDTSKMMSADTTKK
jgi:uncharacterized lipoprotein YajG